MGFQGMWWHAGVKKQKQKKSENSSVPNFSNWRDRKKPPSGGFRSQVFTPDVDQ
jgi:hypothetical protein